MVFGMPAAVPQDLASRIDPAAQEIPPLDELERRLFEAVNRERASRGIPALRPNPVLLDLARKQSGDMAGLGLLAHFSAMGETLTDRLEKAGVFFVANAENVARSDSFDPLLIHESFMKSPEHRQTVLNPEFDEAGVAIVRGDDGAFYVTQDFIKSLVLLDESEVRARILGALDEAARERGSAPLSAVDDVHATARAFAREKAAGRGLPPIPPAYGTVSVRFLTGVDLDRLLASILDVETARFRVVGVGSTFGRPPEHPGGAYVVCVFLLVGSPALDKSVAERRQAVFAALNEARAALGRRPLELDEELCRKADEYNRRQQQRGALVPPRKRTLSAIFYETPELGRVPDEILKTIGDRALRRAGISVLRLETGTGFSVKFSIAVLLLD